MPEPLPLVPMFWGTVAGIGWAILGYGRKKQKEEKITFRASYFLKTVVIGALAGACAGYSGMPIETVVATPFFDKAVNIISYLFGE